MALTTTKYSTLYGTVLMRLCMSYETAPGDLIYLTHILLDKMANILHMIFQDTFLCMGLRV